MANCRQGDIAVGVSAIPEKAMNIGAVVRILDVFTPHPLRWNVEMLSHAFYQGARRPPGTLAIAQDSYLRPLRSDEKPEDAEWLYSSQLEKIGV